MNKKTTVVPDTPLRAARKRRGMSQQQLANEIGISGPQIQRIEIGGIKMKTARKLVQFFGGELTYEDLAVSASDINEAS